MVTDPNGAVLPGASIVATNTDTNYRYSARSNDTGNYSVGQLLEGSYVLTAEAPGFARFEQRGIRIANQELRRIDIRMDLAAVQTAIEVTGGASLIETERAHISDTKGADVIKSLPLNQRSLWDFVGQNSSVIQAANGSAYLLGYEDPNSFIRAFHQWEGTSPGEWRTTRSPGTP